MNPDERKCPACGRFLPLETSISQPDLAPKPGDFSVCLYCAEVLVYQQDLSFIRMPEAEVEKLDLDTLGELTRVHYGIRQLNSMRRLG